MIGLEAKKALSSIDLHPDIIVGCHGGGNNFGGTAIPFIKEKMDGTRDIDIIASEPLACPTLSRGIYGYDYGDAGCYIPLTKMYTLGHSFVPPSLHAGGLRYHGAAPLVSMLNHTGLIRAETVRQKETFDAAILFAKTEGIIPAPEAAHAIASVIKAANLCKENGEEKVILFTLSGHGHFDMGAYETYLSGKLEDYEYPQEAIEQAESKLPFVTAKV